MCAYVCVLVASQTSPNVDSVEFADAMHDDRGDAARPGMGGVGEGGGGVGALDPDSGSTSEEQ